MPHTLTQVWWRRWVTYDSQTKFRRTCFWDKKLGTCHKKCFSLCLFDLQSRSRLFFHTNSLKEDALQNPRYWFATRVTLTYHRCNVSTRYRNFNSTLTLSSWAIKEIFKLFFYLANSHVKHGSEYEKKEYKQTDTIWFVMDVTKVNNRCTSWTSCESLFHRRGPWMENPLSPIFFAHLCTDSTASDCGRVGYLLEAELVRINRDHVVQTFEHNCD
jgi:hypothetical protein